MSDDPMGLVRAYGQSVEETAAEWVEAARLICEAALAKREVEDVTDDLVTWLRAQLDEDERVARVAMPGPWRWADPGERTVKTALMSGQYPNWQPVVKAAQADVWPSVFDADHIARHDPARVLAEVAAKRAIVELHSAVPDEEYCSEDEQRKPCPTVRLLAQPYAGRPGWREEWRP